MISGSSKRTKLWEERAGKAIILSGDGRNDSPSHSAQYCTYSLADMNDNAILQMNIVDVREAGGKSNNMERIGFERAMDKLLTSSMSLAEVVTDGHLEIGALMSKYYYFDKTLWVTVHLNANASYVHSFYSTHFLKSKSLEEDKIEIKFGVHLAF